LAKIAGDRKQRPLFSNFFKEGSSSSASPLIRGSYLASLKPSSVAAHYPGDVYSLSDKIYDSITGNV